MLSSVSSMSKVVLAGGTQMSAVLAFASKIGFNEENTVIGTTSYITDDKSANFVDIVKQIADIPIIFCRSWYEKFKTLWIKGIFRRLCKGRRRCRWKYYCINAQKREIILKLFWI